MNPAAVTGFPAMVVGGGPSAMNGVVAVVGVTSRSYCSKNAVIVRFAWWRTSSAFATSTAVMARPTSANWRKPGSSRSRCSSVISSTSRVSPEAAIVIQWVSGSGKPGPASTSSAPTALASAAAAFRVISMTSGSTMA